jgi:glutamate-1-semialdehyde 2,1-aminomutase
MFITLHMVKRNSLSDPENLSYIISHCKRYPGAKLILAHAARGFAPASAIDSLGALEGLDNIYFDAAAVCEPLALIAIIRGFGPGRLFWGSDYPISADRGKCVSIGDYFHWISVNEAVGNSPGGGSYAEDLALVGVENLIAMDYAVKIAGLTRAEIEDIFYNNAAALVARSL